MKAIDYVYASEGGFEIVIAGPLNEIDSRSQALITISKTDGIKEELFSIAAFGNWEFEYALAMLQGLSNSLIQGMDDIKTKKISPVLLEYTRDMCITLKNHKIDKGKWNIHFTTQDVAYHMAYAYGKDRGESTLGVKIEPEDAGGIARVILRACEEWDCNHLMHVGNDDWIISKDALFAHEAEVAQVHGIVESEEVKKYAPDLIKNIWIRLIRDKTLVMNPKYALRGCCKCRGKIAVDGDWKKECRGCYFDSQPTAKSIQYIKKIKDAKVIKA